MLFSATHLKWSLSSQTLVHNGAYAPQISLGIIMLGHDDLRSLCADKHSLQLRDTVTVQLAGKGRHSGKPLILTMYMGEPHSVAAIVFVWR